MDKNNIEVINIINKYQKKIIIGMVFGIFVYVSFLFYSGFDTFYASIKQTPSSTIFYGLFLAIFVLFLRFIRWYILLPKVNISFFYIFLIYISGFAFSLTPGKVGENFRNIYLSKIGISHTKSINIFIVDRYLELVAILFIICMSSLLTSKYYLAVVSLLFFFTFLLVFMCRAKIFDIVQSSRYMKNKIGKKILSILEKIQENKVHISLNKIIFSLFSGAIAWTIPGYFLFSLLNNGAISLTLIEYISIYSISLAIGLFSFLPGGLGAFEGTMIAMVVHLGITSKTAVYGTILLRLIFLWFTVVLGLISLLAIAKIKIRIILND